MPPPFSHYTLSTTSNSNHSMIILLLSQLLLQFLSMRLTILNWCWMKVSTLHWPFSASFSPSLSRSLSPSLPLSPCLNLYTLYHLYYTAIVSLFPLLHLTNTITECFVAERKLLTQFDIVFGLPEPAIGEYCPYYIRHWLAGWLANWSTYVCILCTSVLCI